jgi:hypothetical protein
MRRLLASVAFAAAAAAGLGGTARADLPTIYVNYTMSCTFGMTNAMGKALTSISPGNYQILVTSPVPFAAVDLVGINDMTACKGSASFQLTGPGVSLTTTMDDGDSDNAFIYATFQPNSTYTAVDTLQPSVARYQFTTSATAAATAGTATTTLPPPTPGSASASIANPPPAKASLIGTVTADGTVTLTLKGKRFTALHTGWYVVHVTDHDPKTGFTLQSGHAHGRAITSGPEVGRTTVTLRLTKGQWYFYASGTGASSSFKVVS